MLTTVFGYGSLINTESLKSTISMPLDISPSFIKGFKRSFNLWDELGFTVNKGNLAGIPYCALDVNKITSNNSRVNGITFKLDEFELIKLLEREHDYTLISTTVYDFETNIPKGECVLFVANKNNGTFDFNSSSQMKYLKICLDGAKEYGQNFYNEFLKTTYIENRAISDIPNLMLSGSAELENV